MVKSLTKFIKSLDYFGKSIDLNFMGQSQFNTLCGGIITAYLYTTFLLYTVQQGISFVKKESYDVSGYTVVDIEGLDKPHNFQEMKGGIFVELLHESVRGVSFFDILDPSYATI